MNYTLLYSIAAVVAGYLIGSLSFAVIVSRVMGLRDPRTYGSKNPGATNVLRSGSKTAAGLTLFLDAFKAWLPMVLAAHFGVPLGLQPGTVALVGLAAFLGHLFPLFFRFAGGKGVATALGVLVGVSGWLGVATGLIWMIMAYALRYSSLASMTSAMCAPLVYVLGDSYLWDMDNAVLGCLVVMSFLLLWRHAANISRLVKGTESQIGARKKMRAAKR